LRIKSKKLRVASPVAKPVETVDEIAARVAGLQVEAERSPSPPPPGVERAPSVDHFARYARFAAQHSPLRGEAGSPSLGLDDVADFLSEDAPTTSLELITEAYHHHILMRIRRRIEEIGGVAQPDGSLLNMVTMATYFCELDIDEKMQLDDAVRDFCETGASMLTSEQMAAFQAGDKTQLFAELNDMMIQIDNDHPAGNDVFADAMDAYHLA
jgi:hypothetical protein